MSVCTEWIEGLTNGEEPVPGPAETVPEATDTPRPELSECFVPQEIRVPVGYELVEVDVTNFANVPLTLDLYRPGPGIEPGAPGEPAVLEEDTVVEEEPADGVGTDFPVTIPPEEQVPLLIDLPEPPNAVSILLLTPDGTPVTVGNIYHEDEPAEEEDEVFETVDPTEEDVAAGEGAPETAETDPVPAPGLALVAAAVGVAVLVATRHRKR